MTPEETELFLTRYRTAWNAQDTATLGSMYAESCIVESPAFGRLTGRSAVQKGFHDWFTTFPDSTFDFGDFLSTGDRSVLTLTVHGTDTGGLFGQGPTGRPFRIFTVLLFALSDRQIVHEQRVYDANGLLLQLANQSGVAAEATEVYRAALARVRMEHELSIAAEIQRALLPEGRYKTHRFELAASSIPCRAIGGDFLDYFDLPDGALGLALGDVAGKGPPAALLAARLQGMVAAYADAVSTPAKTMTRVNRELVRRSVESRFATLLYGVLAADGRLTYCNAGHNPPLLVSRRGVQRLCAGGLIIGAFKDAIFEEETVELVAGDVLVVFSDGVTEALSADGFEFGEERVLASIETHRESAAPVLLDVLIDSVRKFSAGADQSDDLTAMVLRYGELVTTVR